MTVQPYQQYPAAQQPADQQQIAAYYQQAQLVGQQGPVSQQYRRARPQGLSSLVHGFAKAGKSTFADSGPRPTVILDAEGTSFWTPSRKIEWNPVREPPPYPDGSWDSAIVMATEVRVISELYRVLSSGQHWFNSCSIDSITEVQQRMVDELTRGKQMDRDKWGHLLRQVNMMTRQYRDLIVHPTKPLWSVSFTAGTHQRDGRWRPLVQGQSQDYLPYYVDILGYMQALPSGQRHMLIGPHPMYETGERVGGRLPYDLLIGDGKYHQGYTIEMMLRQVLSQ